MQIKEIEVKSILTKSNLPLGGYSVNPYVGCPHACKYCYACFMKRFTNHPEPWGTFIDIKNWEKIKNPEKYKGQHIFIGSVTDPYNPFESKYEKTRQFLKEMQGSGAEISIATKSDLILRDIDLIKSFPNARVSWSINTLDEKFNSDMDRAVSIERRLNAMKIFHDEKIITTCFISPIFPAITSLPKIIERVKNQCNLIWLENLNLRGEFKSVIMKYIEKNYPQYLPLYQSIYNKKDMSYWQTLDEKMQHYAKQLGLQYLTNEDYTAESFDAPPTIVNFFYHEKIKRSAVKKK